jgi:hypothetical protein
MKVGWLVFFVSIVWSETRMDSGRLNIEFRGSNSARSMMFVPVRLCFPVKTEASCDLPHSFEVSTACVNINYEIYD